MAYKTVSIPRLLGLNQDENPDALEPGELTVATNAIRRGNMVGTRPAALAPNPVAANEYADPLTDSPVIEGSFEYRKNFDESRRLFLIGNRTTTSDPPYAGDDIYYEDDANLEMLPLI